MVEMGQFSLLLSLMLCGYAIVADMCGAWRGDRGLIKSGRNATVGCMACITVAIAALLVLFIRDDFSVVYVAGHSSEALPLAYKLSALWAGASGSLMFWLWLQVGFVVLAFCCKDSASSFAGRARVFANILSVFFLVIIIKDKNPFAISLGPVADGMGLNPLLQHPAMVLHPPTLFVGYAGFAVSFSWAMALLCDSGGRGDKVLFFHTVRDWILWSWLFLTIGIVLGAWWAYEELGWGGYWAWDPVENSSLMPWFAATALLHCSRFFRAGSGVSIWVKVLSLVTYSLCIFGTFLTRYGLVASVHAFPEPGLGMLFMVLLGLMWLLAVVLFVRKLARGGFMYAVSEFKGMRYVYWGNYLMLLLILVVLVGTLYPVLSGLFSQEKITLEPVFFTKMTSPFGAALILLISVCPLLLRFGMKVSVRNVCAVIAGLLAGWVWYTSRSLGAAFLILSGFGVVSVAAEVLGFEVRGMFSKKGRVRKRRNARWYGARMVHLGVVLMFVGMAGSGGYGSEEAVALEPGQKVRAGAYTVVYKDINADHGPNFVSTTADISVLKEGVEVKVLRPAMFYYGSSGKTTSEVDLRRTLGGDLYVALTAVDPATRLINLRIMVKPLINWIWIGAGLMVVGTLMVLGNLYMKRRARL